MNGKQRAIHPFRLFDREGLDADTVKLLNVMIIAIIGGTTWTYIATGFTMTGYLKQGLGASDTLYALILALPTTADLFQFLASYLLERWLPRKKTILVSGLIQRLVWIPFGLVPFIIPMEQAHLRIWTVLILALVSASMAPMYSVTLFSLLADAIPSRIRGQYLASRSRISTLVALGFGFLIGAMLDAIPGYTGYAVAFVIAGTMGVADILCLMLAKFPPMKRSPTPESLLRMLGNVFRDRNYVRVTIFGAFYCFATYLARPFFNVYMTEHMNLNNMQMAIFGEGNVGIGGGIASIVMMLVITSWGRANDRFGARPMLTIHAVASAFIPLIWAFMRPGMVWMVGCASVLTGIHWHAFELGTQNMFIKLAPEKNRSMYIAIYVTFAHLGTAIGQLTGGLISDNVLAGLEQMNLTLGSWTPLRYNYLFFLSFLLRILAVALLPGVREENVYTVREIVKAAGRSIARFLSRTPSIRG